MGALAGSAPSRRRAAIVAIACVWASLSLAEVRAEDSEAVSIQGPARVFVERAFQLALDKLGNPACRQIFAEFKDADSVPLEDILRERGESAPEHLRRMRFRDGARHRLCIAPGAYATTRTGALEVFLCGSFESVVRKDPATAANVLIHEELHSLGAGEAPMPGLPPSEEITARVALRCGR